MSTTYGIPLEEVAKQGQGLAFVVFPEALTTFWCPQLWSVIFFVMLYLLGIDTLVRNMEGIPEFSRRKPTYRVVGRAHPGT